MPALALIGGFLPRSEAGLLLVGRQARGRVPAHRLTGGGHGLGIRSAVASVERPGSSFPEGTAIAFAGSASDAQDGNLTASLAWSSNRDGTIGSGGSFSATLSAGAHTVTAQVTDSDGQSGSAQITVTVNGSGPSCPWPLGHAHYCRDCGPCDAGEGDCDGNAQCADGLRCVNDVGADYGFPGYIDVCEPIASCLWPAGHPHYCRDCGPCGAGEGDCDSDAQCGGGLACVDNVGADYGFPGYIDVCE